MSKTSVDRLSIFLSLVLRHKPEAAGTTLDSNGWVTVSELLSGVTATGRTITMELLEEIVATDSKHRYSFNNDHTKIRANQGHSVPVDVELCPANPPETLYHGTAINSLSAIRVEGLTRQSRQYVHLSSDADTARRVGSRHGECLVLIIRAEEMHSNGYEFWLSENGVWLCKSVPVRYIQFAQSAKL